LETILKKEQGTVLCFILKFKKLPFKKIFNSRRKRIYAKDK